VCQVISNRGVGVEGGDGIPDKEQHPGLVAPNVHFTASRTHHPYTPTPPSTHTQHTRARLALEGPDPMRLFACRPVIITATLLSLTTPRPPLTAATERQEELGEEGAREGAGRGRGRGGRGRGG